MSNKSYMDYIKSIHYPKTKQLYIMRSRVKTLELKNLEFFTKKRKITNPYQRIPTISLIFPSFLEQSRPSALFIVDGRGIGQLDWVRVSFPGENRHAQRKAETGLPDGAGDRAEPDP